MKTFKQLAVLVIFTIFATSCKSDDPEPVNEEEVITTLTVTLTPQGGGTAITFKSFDLDGTDGPNPPVITPSSITLDANTTYVGVTKVENETEDPAENITLEVLEEDEEHQFFYTASSSLGTATYTDTDSDGNPIGVAFTFRTADATSGNLTVTLIHEPAKSANGVKAGSIANAGGETDVEAVFPITVQ